jgi:hypothetical protein
MDKKTAIPAMSVNRKNDAVLPGLMVFHHKVITIGRLSIPGNRSTDAPLRLGPSFAGMMLLLRLP